MSGRLETFVEVLRAQADNSALAYTFLNNGEDEVASLTYEQLDKRVRATAVALTQKAAPGDRVLILLPQGLDYVVAFYACLYAGLVAVPV